MGGGFKQDPATEMPGWLREGTVVDTDGPTHRHGSNLDWFVVSPGWGQQFTCDTPGQQQAEIQAATGDHAAVVMRLPCETEL